jgi:hypothetical protein
MLKSLRSLFTPNTSSRQSVDTAVISTPAPAIITAPGAQDFDFRANLKMDNDLPYAEWPAVYAWIDTIPDPADHGEAWSACEMAWLLHLRDALGGDYRLSCGEGTLLLSTLDNGLARTTLNYVGKTQQRVVRVLDGIAEVQPWGSDILIVLDDEDDYYLYVSHYYPDEGEFAFSSGMHINHGCTHFVTTKADLRTIEPIIAHEMTHACLAHLPIPAWLNEGLAVNTEQRLSPQGPGLFTPQEMQRKHRAFWGTPEIQEFWSGKSFLRTDDGNMLSYDLARIIVEQQSRDWERFRDFVLAANVADAGAAAAQEVLGIGLGAYIAALLEQEPVAAWSPDPQLWREGTEAGAF